MAQFGRPSVDTTRTGWTEDDGGTTDIFDQIDEAALDDADYIKTAAPPGSNVYVTKLTTVVDPVSSSGHTIRVRARKQPTGGAQVNLVTQLRQGYTNEGAQGTLIATLTQNDLTDAFVTGSLGLSGAEADAITNYGDLYLRIVATQV